MLMTRCERRSSLLASGCLLALAAAFCVFTVLSFPGQWADLRFYGLIAEGTPRALALALSSLVRQVLILAMPVLVAALGLFAVVKRRWRNVAAAVLTCLTVVPTVWALRQVLPRVDWGIAGGYPYNTFPSTHVAIVAACCWAVWVLWPTDQRRWVAWGLVVNAALAVYGNVATHDHMPSDGLGSLLLTGAVGLAACGLMGVDPTASSGLKVRSSLQTRQASAER